MKDQVIQRYGVCDDRSRHVNHVFRYAEYDTHFSLWSCPGVYVDCLNCDDRKCMDCVLRYEHNRCEPSCPMCCGGSDD